MGTGVPGAAQETIMGVAPSHYATAILKLFITSEKYTDLKIFSSSVRFLDFGAFVHEALPNWNIYYLFLNLCRKNFI